MTVVDASILLKLAIEEADSDAARTFVAREMLIAPDLIAVEVANGLRKGMRDGRTPASDVEPSSDRLVVSVTIVPSVVVRRALQIALVLSHHVHDCVYLALAEANSCRLFTADHKFRAKALASAFDRVVPAY